MPLLFSVLFVGHHHHSASVACGGSFAISTLRRHLTPRKHLFHHLLELPPLVHCTATVVSLDTQMPPLGMMAGGHLGAQREP
ncbi:hypothetical protein HanIR_Chr02g0070261 [Helianthus annuus]|nr:hypothetical protein HanIR_Chr02g0070261 [Helianthus annuus]